jgi:hypothetical protein
MERHRSLTPEDSSVSASEDEVMEPGALFSSRVNNPVSGPSTNSEQWPTVFTGKRLLASRKRYLNLWDLTRTWNRTILLDIAESLYASSPGPSEMTDLPTIATREPSETPEQLPGEVPDPNFLLWETEIDRQLGLIDEEETTRFRDIAAVDRAQHRRDQPPVEEPRLRQRKLTKPNRESGLRFQGNTVPISQLASLAGPSNTTNH